MAGVQQGLEVAFYLYPCGLFATLLVSQSVYYYRERHGKHPAAPATDDPKKAEVIRRFYARLIWVLQLVLSILLVGIAIALAGQPQLPRSLTAFTVSQHHPRSTRRSACR